MFKRFLELIAVVRDFWAIRLEIEASMASSAAQNSNQFFPLSKIFRTFTRPMVEMHANMQKHILLNAYARLIKYEDLEPESDDYGFESQTVVTS